MVCRARDERLERFVALKVLPPRSTDNPDRKLRFVQEAKAASSLNHAEHHHGVQHRHRRWSSYIAMECVNGPTISDVIGRSQLSVERIADIGVQIADALEAAHRANLLHRDLKPGNIMLAEGRLVKVPRLRSGETHGAGAGSRRIGRDANAYCQTGQTQFGVIVGSPAYMSPEQIEAKPLTPASDVFSFGCILYEMAAGRSTVPHRTDDQHDRRRPAQDTCANSPSPTGHAPRAGRDRVRVSCQRSRGPTASHRREAGPPCASNQRAARWHPAFNRLARPAALA